MKKFGIFTKNKKVFFIKKCNKNDFNDNELLILQKKFNSFIFPHLLQNDAIQQNLFLFNPQKNHNLKITKQAAFSLTKKI